MSKGQSHNHKDIVEHITTWDTNTFDLTTVHPKRTDGEPLGDIRHPAQNQAARIFDVVVVSYKVYKNKATIYQKDITESRTSGEQKTYAYHVPLVTGLSLESVSGTQLKYLFVHNNVLIGRALDRARNPVKKAPPQ